MCNRKRLSRLRASEEGPCLFISQSSFTEFSYTAPDWPQAPGMVLSSISIV